LRIFYPTFCVFGTSEISPVASSSVMRTRSVEEYRRRSPHILWILSWYPVDTRTERLKESHARPVN